MLKPRALAFHLHWPGAGPRHLHFFKKGATIVSTVRALRAAGAPEEVQGVEEGVMVGE